MPQQPPQSFSTKRPVKETLCPRRTSKNKVSLFSKLPPPAPEPDVPAANQPLAERMRPLTLDEVHLINTAYHHAFLPHVDPCLIIFIGATTQNPSFEVISPLLSRTKVYVLDPLTTPQIAELLRRALKDKEHGFGNESIAASDDILFRMASFANGDARAAYNTLELAVRSTQSH